MPIPSGLKARLAGPSKQYAGRIAVYYNKADPYLQNLYPYAAVGAGSLCGVRPTRPAKVRGPTWAMTIPRPCAALCYFSQGIQPRS